MIAEAVLTLVVTILSVDQGSATVDRGRLAGLRPGDSGRIYYELTVGGDVKRIDVGHGTLVEVEDSRSRLRIDGEGTVRPGYFVEIEIPLTPSTSSGPGTAAGIDPALRSWIERLVPGNREVQAEIARLVRERRLPRGVPADPAVDREAELRARVAELEAAAESAAAGEDGGGEAEVERLQADLATARGEALRLARELELAGSTRQQLQADLDDARSELSRLATAAKDSPAAEPPAATAPADPDPAGREAPAAAEEPAPETEVVARVEEWARAWSEQRADDYLSFYARGYQPPDGLSRGDWEAQRRSRVLGPAFIEVTLQDLEILSMDAEKATVSFRQVYRSDRFNVAATKVLELKKEAGRWKILEETIQ